MAETKNPDKVFIVHHTFYKSIGWFGLILFLSMASISLYIGITLAFIFFLVFFIFNIYMLLTIGYMEVDSESIRYYSPRGKYQMKWEEIEYIEIDQQFNNMAFFGDNKTLNVIGSTGWSDKEAKRETGTFIAEQIKNLGIEIKRTQKAMFRISKNTKIEKK